MVVEIGMDRQQLDRGDAEAADVVDHLVMAQPVKGAALGLRHGRMELGEAADMRFIEDGAVPRNKGLGWRLRISLPVTDHASGHERRTVERAIAEIAILAGAQIVAVMRIVPDKRPGKFASIGIKQELVGVEPVPLFRCKAAMHPVTIALTGTNPRQIAMKDLVGILRKGYPGRLGLTAVIKKA